MRMEETVSENTVDNISENDEYSQKSNTTDQDDVEKQSQNKTTSQTTANLSEISATVENSPSEEGINVNSSNVDKETGFPNKSSNSSIDLNIENIKIDSPDISKNNENELLENPDKSKDTENDDTSEAVESVSNNVDVENGSPSLPNCVEFPSAECSPKVNERMDADSDGFRVESDEKSCGRITEANNVEEIIESNGKQSCSNNEPSLHVKEIKEPLVKAIKSVTSDSTGGDKISENQGKSSENEISSNNQADQEEDVEMSVEISTPEPSGKDVENITETNSKTTTDEDERRKNSDSKINEKSNEIRDVILEEGTDKNEQNEEDNTVSADKNSEDDKKESENKISQRKFDIMPVRLEKLMDPSKLKNNAFLEDTKSTNPSPEVTPNSSRPQRQAAKKAENQIKELVGLSLKEKKEESEIVPIEKQTICSRCSKLRLCIWLGPPHYKYACKSSCVKILSEKNESGNSKLVNVRIMTAAKYRQTEPVVKEVSLPKNTFPFTSNDPSVRKCSQCESTNIVEGKCVSWETMDFCNEDCLNQYQQKFKACCAFCKKSVEPKSICKYAVRFGIEIKQFCTSQCLDDFKKVLKQCTYCQKDLSKGSNIVQSLATKKESPRDFCSLLCRDTYVYLREKVALPTVTSRCTVCSQLKKAEFQVVLNETTNSLCSDVCFNAFNFTNNMTNIYQCSLCQKHFDANNLNSSFVYHQNTSYGLCSRICRSIFVLFERDIISCAWCKVKKYSFDMIRKMVSGNHNIYLCSLNCLSMLQGSRTSPSLRKVLCESCKRIGTAQYQIQMSDTTARYFCSQGCVLNFQAQHAKSITMVDNSAKSGTITLPVPTGGIRKIVNANATSCKTITVSSNDVQKIAPKVTVTPINGLLPQITSATGAKKVGTAVAPTATPSTKYIQHIIVRPPEPKEIANKIIQCKPAMLEAETETESKCRTEVETQTEEVSKYPAIVPIPVPIYVPVPMHMFTTPCPVALPIPLPIPVPVFLPTTIKTFEKLNSTIKKIVKRTPTNPYEYDLLEMARNVAKDDNDDTGVTRNDSDDDSYVSDCFKRESDNEGCENRAATDSMSNSVREKAEKSSTPVDLEEELRPNTITVKPEGFENSVPEMEEPVRDRLRSRKRTSVTPNYSAETPVRKKTKKQQQKNLQQEQELSNSSSELSTPGTSQSSDFHKSDRRMSVTVNGNEHPDQRSSLKSSIAIRGWKQWLVRKNNELEKLSLTANKEPKLFDLNILKLRTDELDFLLGKFVKEIRKPNGNEYAPDTIYYLCLCIQHYLFVSGRVDNIFSDPIYEKFTDAFDEVARRFSEINSATQFVLTRVEEEHLWESRQLGAHSPHILLATVMYFNTKFFNISTIEEHSQLSFSQITKHLKRSLNIEKTGSVAANKSTVLRFYPLQSALDAPNSRKKKVYELQELEEDVLRCPVKLYEFYLSKCPESVKLRKDVFYLEPEHSCLPDSPVWYSTSPLNDDLLKKMLHRILMVKEVNVSLLAT